MKSLCEKRGLLQVGLNADIDSKFVELLAKELEFNLTQAQKILQDIQQGIDN